jgi:hypothetical protein
VLKAAALTVAGSIHTSPSIRQRASAVAARMAEVGLPRTHDIRVRTDRRTAHYRDALVLARTVIENIRRELEHGKEIVWTFLIRTPELVEAGVRNELRERLGERWDIRKETIPLVGSKMSVAPDLLIGDGDAVGDVKYKRTTAKWRRADLYEVTAFAAAAGASRAAIVGFQGVADPELPTTVGIGDTEVRFFAWHAREDVTPVDAAASLAEELDDWLSVAEPRSVAEQSRNGALPGQAFAG